MARRNREEWQTLIAEQAQSGLTQTAFCAQRGINPKLFSLRKTQPLVKPNPFVQARIPIVAEHVELRWQSATLILPATLSPQWVAGVLKALA